VVIALVLGLAGLGAGTAYATDRCAEAYIGTWACSQHVGPRPDGDTGAFAEHFPRLCQILGIQSKLCERPTYVLSVGAGFLPCNPASGDSPVIRFNNSVYCDPGDTATGEVRVTGLPEGYTYEAGQSPDNPNSVYVAITRPPTDFDYTRPATHDDLVRFRFDFVCRDDASPYRTN
jgi:hypothetical protein